MAEFILFDNDIHHFHTFEEIQRHLERQLPYQVSVDDVIPFCTQKQQQNQ